MKEKKSYDMSLKVEYETTDGKLSSVDMSEVNVKEDFEGIVFSIFGLLAQSEEFINIPEEGLTQEVKEAVFKRKQLYIRAIISGMMNYLNIMNDKVNGGVDVESYLSMSSRLGDILVAMAATASNIHPDRYRELTKEFYDEYITKERSVKTKPEPDQPPRPRDFS